MTIYNEEIQQYIERVFAREDEHARRARIESPQLGLPAISIRPEEGKFLQLLTAATGAKRAVEIGTLGGYSGIWIARGLAPGGELITIDLNEFHSKTAHMHFEAAGLHDRVELLTGEAIEVLQQISNRGPFDFVFIDADKDGYIAYYEWAVENVRTGGLIAAHNAFRGGRILEENDAGRGMREFLEHVAADGRVNSSIYPGGDGTLVAVKR